MIFIIFDVNMKCYVKVCHFSTGQDKTFFEKCKFNEDLKEKTNDGIRHNTQQSFYFLDYYDTVH